MLWQVHQNCFSVHLYTVFISTTLMHKHLLIWGQMVADTEIVKKADPPKTMKNI